MKPFATNGRMLETLSISVNHTKNSQPELFRQLKNHLYLAHEISILKNGNNILSSYMVEENKTKNNEWKIKAAF